MRLKQSIDQILAQTDPRLAEIFYKILFKEHPELRDFFADTDMDRQKLMLTMALQVVAYYHRNPNAAMAVFIEGLGTSHHKRGIDSSELVKFRDALLVAIAKFHGGDCTDELIAEWTEAIDGAIELMKAGVAAYLAEQ